MICQGHGDAPAEPRHDKPAEHHPGNRKKPHARKPTAHKPTPRKPVAHKPGPRKRQDKPGPKGKRTAGRGEVELIWFDDIAFAPLATGGYIH